MLRSRQSLLMLVSWLVVMSLQPCCAEVNNYTWFRHSMTLIDGLDLSKDQVRQMLPVVREAVHEKEKIQKEILETKGDAIRAYELLKQELGTQ